MSETKSNNVVELAVRRHVTPVTDVLVEEKRPLAPVADFAQRRFDTLVRPILFKDIGRWYFQFAHNRKQGYYETTFDAEALRTLPNQEMKAVVESIERILGGALEDGLCCIEHVGEGERIHLKLRKDHYEKLQTERARAR